MVFASECFEAFYLVIGVISDTHGLLRPEAVAALRGSEHIIHAGDIGAHTIIPALEEIAPVTAIRGNNDREGWALKFPETAVVELARLDFYIVHDINDLDLKPQAAGFAAVISGHSHHPYQETTNGVLYFNPGAAGPRRFKLPITVGRIEIDGEGMTARVIELEL